MSQLPGVVFDYSHIVAAGVSDGGFMSVPIASRYPIYTHAMIFHARCGCLLHGVRKGRLP